LNKRGRENERGRKRERERERERERNKITQCDERSVRRMKIHLGGV
jgi:hypothetical protein